jgi:zinc transporter ZupT
MSMSTASPRSAYAGKKGRRPAVVPIAPTPRSTPLLKTPLPPLRNGKLRPPSLIDTFKEVWFTSNSTALLSIASDAAHNFTDGVVLGATFLTSASAGWRAVVAVLVHEIPHELGDYAVLQRCGFDRRKIIRTQLLTATANLLGAVLVSMAGTYFAEEVRAVLMPLVAGSFLYMSLVTLLGDARSSLATVGTLELCGMTLSFLAGLALLYSTAYVEDALDFHH